MAIRAKSIVGAVGSLFFSAVLLVLLLVAMGFATAFESMHGTEQALHTYYYAWWFQLLMALLAMNALAALIARFPFSKRQIGFVLTHGGILIILAGALISERFGVSGQMGIAEGESVDRFAVAGRERVMVAASRDGTTTGLDLSQAIEDPFRPAAFSNPLTLTAGSLNLQVLQYLPDSEWRRSVVDDGPVVQPAVEVSLSATGQDDPVWVFDDHTEPVGGTAAAYRHVADQAELARVLSAMVTTPPSSKGKVKIERQGAVFEFSVEEGLARAMPLGDAGYTARVVRYLPHATVGAGREISNASDRPVNPYVEVEIAGPTGTETRRAFAKFPDFASGHGAGSEEQLRVRLIADSNDEPDTPVRVLSGPDGRLYASFHPEAAAVWARETRVGAVMESPWPDLRFSVLRRYERAQVRWGLEPVDPPRQQRVPGVLVRVSTPVQANEMWLQKYRAQPFTLDGAPYEIAYAEEPRPLGCSIKLDRFQIVTYPGGMRPRSFESHVTANDPATGLSRSAVISMNHPLKFAGYTFYQSSYRQDGGQSVTFLSVSRDWGQPVVFIGYFTLMLGMVVVLATRIVDQRRERSMKVPAPHFVNLPVSMTPPRSADAESPAKGRETATPKE